jgi:hypothetical protein
MSIALPCELPSSAGTESREPSRTLNRIGDMTLGVRAVEVLAIPAAAPLVSFTSRTNTTRQLGLRWEVNAGTVSTDA